MRCGWGRGRQERHDEQDRHVLAPRRGRHAAPFRSIAIRDAPSISVGRLSGIYVPGAADTLPQTDIPAGTIFDVYGKTIFGDDYAASASVTTANGHRVVRSAGLYLDQLCDPGAAHFQNMFLESEEIPSTYG